MRRSGVRIPLPPIFTRIVGESEGCRFGGGHALSTASIEANARAAFENDRGPMYVHGPSETGGLRQYSVYFWTD